MARFVCSCGEDTGRITWHCECGHHYPLQAVRCDRCKLSHRRYGVRPSPIAEEEAA